MNLLIRPGVISRFCYPIAFVGFTAFGLLLQAETTQLKHGEKADAVVLSVNAEEDTYYAVEKSHDLKTWIPVEDFDGAGERVDFNTEVDGSAVFFRFVSEENGELVAPVNYPLLTTDKFSEGGTKTAHLLAEAGYEDANAVLNEFRSVYRLNRGIDKLHAAGVAVDSGEIVHLVREIELRGNMAPMVEEGLVAEATVDSLLEADLSVGLLHDLLGPVAEELVTVNEVKGAVSVKAADKSGLDRRNRETMRALNNELAAVGGAHIGAGEYLVLRDRVGALRGMSNKAIRGTHQDKAEGRENPEESPYRDELRNIGESPEDMSYLGGAAQAFNEARLRKQAVPMIILGSKEVSSDFNDFKLYVEVGENPPFTRDEEGSEYRRFLVNRECLAGFMVYGNAKGGNLEVLSPDGEVLIDQAVAAQEALAFYLVIPQDMVCREYQVHRDSSLSLKLVSMDDIEPLDEFEDSQGLHAHMDVPVRRLGVEGGASWYRFSLYEGQDANAGTKRSLKLHLYDEADTPATRQVVLRSPQGKLTQGSLEANTDTEITMTEDSGIWDLFVWGQDAAIYNQLNDAVLGSVPQPLASDDSDTVSLDIELGYSPMKTRSFVLGVLESASFIRDGEKQGNRAEIKLTLTANIAPYFDEGESFSTIFEMDGAYDAWKLWKDNGYSLSGIESDPAYVKGIASIRANDDVEAHIPFNDGSVPASAYGDEIWLAAFQLYLKSELEYDWYDQIGSAESLYDSWSNTVTQINAMKYPWGNRYNIRDSIVEGLDFDPDTLIPTEDGFPMHPILPVGIPTFAMPKDRLGEECPTINFSYSAVDYDELDKWDLVGSVVKGVVNIGLCIYEGNFVDAVCGGVAMVDEMNTTLQNAKDDPIGTANFRLNRFSSAHGFYGLDDDRENMVVYSGYSKENSDNMLTNALSWATLGCDAMDLFGVGYPSLDIMDPESTIANLQNQYQGVYDIVTGDISDLGNLRDSCLLIAGSDQETIARINEFFDDIESGVLDGGFAQSLNFSDLTASLTNGNDVWSDLDTMYSNIQNMGGAGSLGQNMVHSNANYLFNGYETRKTQGRSSVGIVRSVPLRSLNVQLSEVKVFDLQEKLGLMNPTSEVFLNTRVGVVSDELPVTWTGVELYDSEDGVIVAENGSQGYLTVGKTPFTAYARKKFPKRNFRYNPDDHGALPADGTWFPRGSGDPDPVMIDVQWDAAGSNNAAAIYVEVGVYEDDGATCDDDMIGVYSNTFRLEDIIKSGKYTWEQSGASTWTLRVEDAPVFSARWLETEVEIGSSEAIVERERAHNEERLQYPSALVSFEMTLELGAFETWVDEIDYDVPTVEPAVPETGVNMQVKVASDAMNLDQILDYQGGRLLAHQWRDAFGDHVLELWQVDAETPDLSPYFVLSSAGLDSSAAAIFDDDEYLNAVLSRDGRYIFVLSRNALTAFDLLEPELSGFEQVDLSGLYPSRIAVDQDNGYVYVSLRKSGKDLQLYEMTDQGVLSLVTEVDDIPRSIAGLYALPEGGMILHYVGNMTQDSSEYGLGYWDDSDDIVGELSHKFENSNGFLYVTYEEGTLVRHSFINLAGKLKEVQMSAVDNPHQSSMFMRYTDRSIISAGSSYPFTVALNSDGFFNSMDGANEHREIDGVDVYTSRKRGTAMGKLYVSPVVSAMSNQEMPAARDAFYDAGRPSPMCAFPVADIGVAFLNTEAFSIVSESLIPAGDSGNTRVLTLLHDVAGQPWPNRYLRKSGGRANVGRLAMIDLKSDNSTGGGGTGGDTEEPAVGIVSLIPPLSVPFSVEAVEWVDDDTVVIGWAAGLTDAETLSIVDVSDAAHPAVGAYTGANLMEVQALAAGFSDGSIFSANENRFLNQTVVASDGSISDGSHFYLSANDAARFMAKGVPGKNIVITADSDSNLHVFSKTDGAWADAPKWYKLDYVPNHLAVSPDGNYVCVGGYNEGDTSWNFVRVYDINILKGWLNGENDNTGISAGFLWMSEAGTIADIAYSADGNRLYVSMSTDDGRVYAIDTSDPDGFVNLGYWSGLYTKHMCTTPDSRGLISLNYGAGVYVLDTSNLTSKVELGSYSVYGGDYMSLSPDGSKLAILVTDVGDQRLVVLPLTVLLGEEG